MAMETQTLDYNNREYANAARSANTSIDGNGSEELAEASESRRGLGIDQGLITEIEAYQGLMLDFEREYSEFLSSDLPKCPAVDSTDGYADVGGSNDNGSRNRQSGGGHSDSCRRSSGPGSSRSSIDATNGSGSSNGIRYNFDGTISCCDLSYDLLVSYSLQIVLINFFWSVN